MKEYKFTYPSRSFHWARLCFPHYMFFNFDVLSVIVMVVMHVGVCVGEGGEGRGYRGLRALLNNCYTCICTV